MTSAIFIRKPMGKQATLLMGCRLSLIHWGRAQGQSLSHLLACSSAPEKGFFPFHRVLVVLRSCSWLAGGLTRVGKSFLGSSSE